MFHDLEEALSKGVFLAIDIDFLGHDFDNVIHESHDFAVIIFGFIKFKIDVGMLENVVDVIFHVVDWLDFFTQSLVGFHFLGLGIFDHQVLYIVVKRFVDEEHKICQRNAFYPSLNLLDEE